MNKVMTMLGVIGALAPSPIGVHICSKCGSTKKVSLAECMLHGNPKCCGSEMPVDLDASVVENEHLRRSRDE